MATSGLPARIKLEFFYDCLSPFSYHAFVVLTRYKAVWKDADIELKPFLLGGVMASTGNLPPMARPWASSAATESVQHLQRNKEFFNVPNMLDSPGNFFGPKGPSDKNGLSMDFRYQRTLTAIRRLHPEVLQEATRLVFEQIWVNKAARDERGHVAMNENVLVNICEQAGLSPSEAERCVRALDAPETKELLKASVSDAVSRGAYGAPTMIVSGVPGRDEMIFFGSDRFEQLAFVCGLPWFGPDPSRATTFAKL